MHNFSIIIIGALSVYVLIIIVYYLCRCVYVIMNMIFIFDCCFVFFLLFEMETTANFNGILFHLHVHLNLCFQLNDLYVFMLLVVHIAVFNS